MDRKKLIFRSGIILVLLLAVILLPRSCDPVPSVKANPDLLSILLELREELEAPGIDVKTAAANLQTPEAALTFVREGTMYIPYPQTFADPNGVLRTRVANSADRCRLLVALLEEMGFEARIATDSRTPPGELFSGTFNRETPATLQKLADYLGHDLSGTESEFDGLEEEFEKLSASMQKETAKALTKVKELAPEVFENGEVMKPYFKTQPDWHWVQYRKTAEEDWTQVDPTHANTEFPGSANNAKLLTLRSSETSIVVEGVRGDGSRLTLLTWTGESVGRDLNLLFLPSDRNPRELFDLKEPNEIWAWAPVLQVGQDTTRGKAFTPDGALMANLSGETAVKLDEKGDASFYAPPVLDMKVMNATCGDGKRVRVRLAVSTEEAPRWHAGHFSVLDEGKPVRNLRMESVHSEPRPIILVVDTSGSMNDDAEAVKTGRPTRAALARTAAKSLIDSLPPTQPLAIISHGSSRILTERKLAPLSEGDAKATIDNLYFSGVQRILGSVNKALEMTEEPAYVVFLTDGEDSEWDNPGYNDFLSETLNAIRKSDSSLLPVGIGEADARLLSDFATASGTSYLAVNSVEELPKLYAHLGNVLSGSVELSYAIPGTPVPGTERNLKVTLENFDGESPGLYTVNEGTRFGLERIELKVSSNPYLSSTRVLADFSDGYDGWQMMQQVSFWVTPSVYPQHIVESRQVDQWIETLRIAEFMDGGELDHSELGRSFSFEHASTTNALRIFHTAATPDIPPPFGPAIIRMSRSFRLENIDVILTTQLDRMISYEWPTISTREDLSRHYLALNTAEAAVFGTESVNATLLAATEPLGVYRTGDDLPEGSPNSLDYLHRKSDRKRIMIVQPEDPSIGWNIHEETAAVYPYLASGNEIAKGASAEAVAAKYNELRSLLQIYAVGGGGAISAAGLPTGAVFSALCAFFDQVVGLYCYSAVMMNQVAEGIESGEFNAAEAVETASRLCKVSGDPEGFARELVRKTAWGFVKGTAKGTVAGLVGGKISQAAGIGAASTSAAAVRGATATTVGAAGNAVSNATPDSVSDAAGDIIMGIGNLGRPSAVSSPSLMNRVEAEILGE